MVAHRMNAIARRFFGYRYRSSSTAREKSASRCERAVRPEARSSGWRYPSGAPESGDGSVDPAAAAPGSPISAIGLRVPERSDDNRCASISSDGMCPAATMSFSSA